MRDADIETIVSEVKARILKNYKNEPHLWAHVAAAAEFGARHTDIRLGMHNMTAEQKATPEYKRLYEDMLNMDKD